MTGLRQLVEDVRDAFHDAVDKSMNDDKAVEPLRKRVSDAFIDMVENLTYDVEDRLKDRLDQYASERADKIIAAFLLGDEEALREYLKLGPLQYSGRQHAGAYAYETGTFEKRQAIFTRNAEWLTNERVADLEAKIVGLEKRVKDAEDRANRAFDARF